MLDRHKRYLLFTPGPLTTTDAVKTAMHFDMPTRDRAFADLVQSIRHDLVALAHGDHERYTAVVLPGSGTYAVEAALGVLHSCKRPKLLILINGTYGWRMAQIAKTIGIRFVTLEFAENETVCPERLNGYLKKHPSVTHVACVHLETTTGILNPLEALGAIVRKHKKYFLVDAMSSFGGVPLDIKKSRADFLISSSNKCLQGVPGIAFVVARKKSLQAHRKSHSVALGLYDQWQFMEENHGSFRFTAPTHVLLALRQALDELIYQEGGVANRHARYQENMRVLLREMMALGFIPHLHEQDQSPVITTFIKPEWLDFEQLYETLKQDGFVIYPGKLTQIDTFRIGTIGDLRVEEIMQLTAKIREFLQRQGEQQEEEPTL